MIQILSNNDRNQPWSIVGVLVVGSLICTGCSPLAKTPTDWFSLSKKKEEAVVPDRVLPIWTDTVLHQPGEKGVRGFGGRVYFYKDGADQPVPVDGSLSVYVFDGDYFADDSTKPLKKYIIKSEQLKELESKSKLGVSYNVWIPWEEVGGTSEKLNLIARFDGVNGGTVISNSSTKLLPGIDAPVNEFKAERIEAKVDSNQGVVPASLIESEEPGLTRPNGLSPETTIFSIDLPSSLERKINTGSSFNEAENLDGDSLDGDSLDSQLNSEFWRTGVTEGDLRERPHSKNSGTAKENLAESVSQKPGQQKQGQQKQENGLFRNWGNVTLGKVGSQARVTGEELQSRFERRRFRAQSESEARPGSYLLRTQPHRATWQSGLPPTPRSNR